MSLASVTLVGRLCSVCALVCFLSLFICMAFRIWVMDFWKRPQIDRDLVFLLFYRSHISKFGFGCGSHPNLSMIESSENHQCCLSRVLRTIFWDIRPFQRGLVQKSQISFWTAGHCCVGRYYSDGKAQQARRISRHTLFTEPLAQGQHEVVDWRGIQIFFGQVLQKRCSEGWSLTGD